MIMPVDQRELYSIAHTPVDDPEVGDSFEFNRLAANVLLTVQALQQLHEALDAKFTRSPSHET